MSEPLDDNHETVRSGASRWSCQAIVVASMGSWNACAWQ